MAVLNLTNLFVTHLIFVKGTTSRACGEKFCYVEKGTGDFEWCRQTMDELCVFGTSRTSNELKSEQ